MIRADRLTSYVCTILPTKIVSEQLISAISKYLSFTTSIYLDKFNTSRLKVSSIRSIENVIKFINNAPVKLLGNKKLQYLL